MVNLTREMALQYAKLGITVNVICPGYYRTNMGNRVYETKEFVEAAIAGTPLGRIAEASEIRGPAIFLASSASNYMTGQTLVLDGGCLA